MKVAVYVINKGTPTQYFGLKGADENTVLLFAPNNWKTEKGAINWAIKHGYEIKAAEVVQNGNKMPKRKKLTEKEWKKQLEEKAAFEAAEKAEAEQLIYNKLRTAQIGDEIIEISMPEYREKIVEIDREDCNGEPEYFTFVTDYGNIYEGFDFLNSSSSEAFVAFAPEKAQEEPNEDQLTFDDVAYLTNEAAENSADSTTVCKNEEKAAFSPVLAASSSAFGKVKRKNSIRTLKNVRAVVGGVDYPESFKNCTVAVGRGSPPCPVNQPI